MRGFIALAAVAVACLFVAPASACDGACGGEVFSAPVYAPQAFAAPVYQAPVFAAPVYQQPVFRAPVFAAPPHHHQSQFRQRSVNVFAAQRQPIFGRGRSKSVNVQRNVQRGVQVQAGAIVY